MINYLIRNIPVNIADDVAFTDEVRIMVERYARQRLAKPIIAYPSPDEKDKILMRFARPDELSRCVAYESKQISLGQDKGTIHTTCGLKARRLRREDLEFAKRLWLEPICVEPGQDGQPWIDD